MFTKGKWQVGYNDGSGRFGKHKGAYSSSVTCANHLLATVWHHDEDDYPKDHPIMIAKANAHLIAAAPDQNECLHSVKKTLEHYLERLEYRQTGNDPKTNGFAFAAFPDWELRHTIELINDVLNKAEGKS